MAKYKHFLIDLVYMAASVLVAVFLIKRGLLTGLADNDSSVLASFLSGIFFTSAFTIAPAAAVLGVIATKISPWIVALFGAAGAVIGDLIIFSFMKDRFADDIMHLIGPNKKHRHAFFHLRLFRWLTPFVGALIIASPLPDELGLFLLGLSKTKTHLLIPISFVMNFVGVLLVALVAGAIG
ncbi:MAG TPA: hypothetical protein VJJ27_00135 [Candidatus Paceibacterota bacterium]